jgi:EAL domain-containing protein (putative c-di-GMP-specific phosphodiesterase class I)/GGDEF domain-containing protein
MSLIKQLWLAILAVTSLALAGSLVVSTLAARHYLENELTMKNIDNAGSLALSLSHMPKDPVTLELQISAQFDTGHYSLIRLTGPKGEPLVERRFEGDAPAAPAWFVGLIPISAQQGIAQVQDGWRQFGTLTVAGHDRVAYESLWRATQRQLLWFFAVGALCGVAGSLMLARTMQPLRHIVDQATAIGERRFITTPEPATKELRSVAAAMNALSGRIRHMLGEESDRLELLRLSIQHDELTGLLTRAQFLRHVQGALSRDDAKAGGTLVIGRLRDTAGLNRLAGREQVDDLLRALGLRLRLLAERHPSWAAGRLNGTDFALLACGDEDAESVCRAVREQLDPVLDAWHAATPAQFPVGASAFSTGTAIAQLLARVDGALAASEQDGERAVRIAASGSQPPTHTALAEWRRALVAALDAGRLQLARYPVLSAGGQLMHFEAPARLHLDGAWQNAGYFMPWVARLNLSSRVDAAVVRAALEHIARSGEALGINIAVESLREASFRNELLGTLGSNPAAARGLWIEVPEYDVLQHPAEFRELCGALRPFGCKVGIEHAGRHFNRIGGLHDLGLDYIKIDASMIDGADSDPHSQSFLRGLCVLAHSIGLTVIAEGVGSAPERQALAMLGIDGMTGSGIRLQD